MALVLCTGVDAGAMKTRQLILVQAGHTVIIASTERQVETARDSQIFSVAVIGQNAS